jgi:hypothetical protein
MPFGQLTAVDTSRHTALRRRSRLDSGISPFTQGAAMPQHAAMIAALLSDRPTCLNCAASTARLSGTEGLRYLEIIATTLVVLRLENEHCRVCGTVGPVFCVRRPSTLRCPAGDHCHHRIDGDLHAKARLLAQTREIPSIRVTDNTAGKPCSLLCGREITRGEVWYELRACRTSLLLDHACFEIWQHEMERAKDAIYPADQTG